MIPRKLLLVANGSSNIDKQIAELRQSCFVERASTMAEAKDAARHLLPDVVILESGLVDGSVFEFLTCIRESVGERPPTFVVAMPVENSQPATGLREHEPSESTRSVGRLVEQFVDLLAASRMPSHSSDRLQCHGLTLDRSRHRVWLDDELLHMTPTEFKLLWEFASHPGHVLSRARLLTMCQSLVSDAQARTVDAHIKSIRRKLGENARLIETVHGLGYRFLELEHAAP